MKTHEMITRFGVLTVTLVTAVTLLFACQSGPPQIRIEGAKAELSAAIVGEAMVTMKLKNDGGPDVLTGVKTDIPGAKVFFHEMQGERMTNAESMKIPARTTTELKMGGSHIMIDDLPKTITEGSHFNITLVFAKSGEQQIPLTLQGSSMMNMGHEHHM